MATGTVTFSATKNIQPSEQQTTSTGGGILVSMGTYSLPTGCTYSGRAKVTKSVSGSLQFSWRDKEKYGETGWDTWYTVSTSKFKNSSNTVQVYVKNNSGSYINGTWSVVVEYNYPSRTVTVGSTTGGTATSSKSSASYGDTVTITATPSTGYSFSGWTTTGGTIANPNSATTTLTMPNANVTVTASFTVKNYTLTTAVSPTEGGSVTSGGTIAYNSNKTLVATPNSGYVFNKWTKTAGTLSSTSATTTTFTMPASNATVTANFVQEAITMCHVFASSNSVGGSCTSIDEAYSVGDTIELTATPNQGYAFDGWTATAGSFSSASSTSTTYTVPSENSASITAHFRKTHNCITVEAGDVSWETGNGTLTIGCNMINTSQAVIGEIDYPAVLVVRLGVKI